MGRKIKKFRNWLLPLTRHSEVTRMGAHTVQTLFFGLTGTEPNTPTYFYCSYLQEMLSSGSLVMVQHVKFGFILLLILIIALGIFAASRFKLNRQIGVSFFLMYIAFVVYAYIQDMLCSYDC